MRLQNMTWREIDGLSRDTVVVAQFGAMEQHGPHLPMATDALIGSALAAKLDEACGNRLLVLPTQWLGLSTHHMAFPGTITVTPETFMAMAFDLVTSIASAGFRKMLVLNSHGGNASALDVALMKCKTAYPKHLFVGATYWNVVAKDLDVLRESAVGGMGHACELETSLVMAERPDLVQISLFSPDGRWPTSRFLAKDMLHPGKASLTASFDEISDKGTVGDPRSASAEKGEAFFSTIVRGLSELVQEMESGSIRQFNSVGRNDLS